MTATGIGRIGGWKVLRPLVALKNKHQERLMAFWKAICPWLTLVGLSAALVASFVGWDLFVDPVQPQRPIFFQEWLVLTFVNTMPFLMGFSMVLMRKRPKLTEALRSVFVMIMASIGLSTIIYAFAAHGAFQTYSDMHMVHTGATFGVQLMTFMLMLPAENKPKVLVGATD